MKPEITGNDDKKLTELLAAAEPEVSPAVAEKALTAMQAAVPVQKSRRRVWIATGTGIAILILAVLLWPYTNNPTTNNPVAATPLGGTPLLAVIAIHQPVRVQGGGALVLGDRLPAGKTVVTGSKGRVSLVTRLGSEFTLAPNSRLAVARDGKSARLAAGRLYCRNRNHEFAAINTDPGKIVLLGTTIDAAVQNRKSVAITVVEGTIRVENAHGEADVSDGKQTILNAADAPTTGEAVNITEETAWYDGRGSVVSDYGEINYSVTTNEPGNSLPGQIWAMNTYGSNKHLVRSLLGWGGDVGQWLPGQQAFFTHTKGLGWVYPDANTNTATFITAGINNSILTSPVRTWLVNIVSGQDTTLELMPDFETHSAIFSPNLQYVAILSYSTYKPSMPLTSKMYIYNLVTGKVERELPWPTKPAWSPPSWSSDSITIATRYCDGQRNFLAMVDIDTGTVTDLGVDGYAPAFSPDNTQLAYNSLVLRPNEPQKQNIAGALGDDVQASDIYVMDLASRQVQRISQPGEMHSTPMWSPDGTKLLYYNDSLMRYGVPGFSVAAADGSWSRSIYGAKEEFINNAAWAPDSKSIYVNRAVQTPDQYYQDLLLISAEDGSVLGHLGGNAQDSVLAPSEKEQVDAALVRIRQALFRASLGRVYEYEGKLAESRRAYHKAAEMFASLPYDYPLACFSTLDTLAYADALLARINQTDGDMLDNACKDHLKAIGELLNSYRDKHDNDYPANLQELRDWAAQEKIAANGYLRIDDADIAEATFHCATGADYIYTPPEPGKEEWPRVSCPHRH
jgi:hypothetical protein